MKIFKSSIKTNKENSEITKSLKSLILKPPDSIFFFPFSLFQRKFYQQIRENRHAFYSGEVNQKGFKFIKYIQYGNLSSGSRTSRVLKINGQIIDENGRKCVTLDFVSPTYEVVIKLLIVIGCLTGYFLTDNKLFLAFPILLVWDFIWHLLRNYWIIRKRIK
ncbi:hypothetical protein [Mangrovibacterium lignilyticum]|uniref:hypothetical protein n=1 Tax=Mangrovibacterium lignilyticum TaxID=2668052 RepID=UPI0013D7A0E6|nr:hypothetical protein [Mangrovibacterium lignilyticum]